MADENLSVEVDLNEQKFRDAAIRMQNELAKIGTTADKLKQQFFNPGLEKAVDNFAKTFKSNAVAKAFKELNKEAHKTEDPIKKANKAMKEFRRDIMDANYAFRGLATSWSSFSAVGGVIGSLAGGPVGAVVGGGVGAIADMLVDIAKAFGGALIDSIKFGLREIAQSELRGMAFGYNFPKAVGGATAVRQYARGANLPFMSQDIEAATLSASLGNPRSKTSNQEILKLVEMASQLSVFQGDLSREGFMQKTDALKRLSTKGKFDVRAATQLGLPGVDEQTFIKDYIAFEKSRRDKGAPHGHFIGEKEAMKEMGDKSGKWIGDILHTIDNEINRAFKDAGTTTDKAMTEAKNTLSYKFDKIFNLPHEYFQELQISNDPSVKEFKGALDDLMKGLDPKSEGGKEILKSISEGMTDVAKAMKEALTPSNINALKDLVIDLIKLGDAAIRAVPKLETIIGVLSPLTYIEIQKDKIKRQVTKAVEEAAEANSMYGPEPEPKKPKPLSDAQLKKDSSFFDRKPANGVHINAPVNLNVNINGQHLRPDEHAAVGKAIGAEYHKALVDAAEKASNEMGNM